MKKQVEDWVLLADRDLRAAEIILKDEYALMGKTQNSPGKRDSSGWCFVHDP